jgi:GAF domain-containing protein
LASAVLFYRDSPEGALGRVRSEGWSESHATELDPESLLVRYCQAEHAALRLDDEQAWLPAGMPEGSAHPVLAIPIVTQHVLTAVVLYGAHVNSTLPDPDEVALLEALAKAAATSHQQVRIAMLQQEKAAAEREAEARQIRVEEQQKRISDLEASSAELRALVRARLSGPQGAG